MKEIECLNLSPGELVDRGLCPTCLNRKYAGAIYGDLTDKMLYEDDEIECFFVGNPRARGHMCISTIEHYHDLSEAPDRINEKIVRFAKQFMLILREVYQCERVYLCSMCDGPVNHYHVQLIPRYGFEKRGSQNFVKPRTEYVFDEARFHLVREKIAAYAKQAPGESVRAFKRAAIARCHKKAALSAGQSSFLSRFSFPVGTEDKRL